MEKKVTSKKKAKAQVKREDSATKFSIDCSETCETSEDSSLVKAKKSRKRKMSFEEDIIDGFLMVSYASLEDLEADGPLKPGAILVSAYDAPQLAAPTKRKRENRPAGKGTNGERPKVPKKTLPRKPKAFKAEKSKLKSKKKREFQATISKPDAPLAILTEENNQPIEVIKNANEKKDGFIKPLSGGNGAEAEGDIDGSIVAAGAVTVITPADAVSNEKIASKITSKEKKCSEHQQQRQQHQHQNQHQNQHQQHIHPPRKPLSDFSINAIQSMRGSSSVPPNQELNTSVNIKDPDAQSESTALTKSIATMTAEPKQDKSISPMEFVMRKETGFQYSRFEETKISARLGCLSPIKSSYSSDDTFVKKSFHRQIDLTGTTITGSGDKSRSVISSIKGREIIRKDSKSHSPRQHPESRPPSSSGLSSSQESTKHQHQHQHIHQHQHSHQHQHFHPPYGMVPNGVFPPSYYGGMPYLPSGSIPPHTHLPKPVPKPGKWCSVHVRIAHFITKKQKEAERVSHLNQELVPNRTGLHAFQAVQSRTSYDREFLFHSSVRPHLSISPKAVHQTAGLHRGSISRDSERHPFHMQGRHNPYYHPRDNLPSNRSDFEPPFPYESLNPAIGNSYHGLFERDRSSPPHLESMYHRRGSERAASDMDKPSGLLHHDRGILSMSIDRETHHESERHRHTSFLNRDKSSYFQPVKVDTQSYRSLTSHGICATNDLTRKPSPRRLSPLSSSFPSQKTRIRGSELFDRIHQDHLDHRRYFGGDSRLLSSDNRLFGQENRLFSSENRLLGASDTRLFDAEKRLPTAESRALGADTRKGLLPFRHDAPSVSHSVVLNSMGRMSSKYSSSS